MKEEESKILSKLGKEPGFKTPENYFSDFQNNIAEKLPNLSVSEEKVKPNLWVRFRPYVYMAAMFAGLGLFFKTIARFDASHTDGRDTTSLLVKSINPTDSKKIIMESTYDEDEEFLHYLENQYTDVLMQETLDGVE